MKLKFDFKDCSQKRHFEREDVTNWMFCRDWEYFAYVLVVFISLSPDEPDYILKIDLDNVDLDSFDCGSLLEKATMLAKLHYPINSINNASQ